MEEDSSAEQERAPRRRSFGRVFGDAIKQGIVVGGFAVTVAAATVWRWTPELRPLWTFLAFGVVPLAMVTIFLGGDPDEEDAGERSGGLLAVLRRLAPTLGWALLFGAPLVMWSWPSTRVEVAAELGRHDARGSLEACLSDPDVEVARRCCLELQARNYTLPQERIAARLMDEAGTPPRCFVEAVDGTSLAAASGLATLAGDWEAELRGTRDFDDGDGRACTLASRLRDAAHLEETRAPRRLLRCALEASHIQARGCCAQALRSMAGPRVAISELLAAPEAMDEAARVELASMVVEHAFASPESQRDAAMAPIYELLSMQDHDRRIWALELGCAALQEPGSAGARTGPDLSPILGEDGGRRCGLQSPPDRVQWASICEGALEESRLAPTDSPVDVLVCSAAKRRIGDRALTYARAYVQRSMREAHSRYVDVAIPDLPPAPRREDGGEDDYVVTRYDYDSGGEVVFSEDAPEGLQSDVRLLFRVLELQREVERRRKN